MKSKAFLRKSPIANQKGFNLIEVMVSVTIVAAVAAGLVGSTITTIKSNAMSRDAMTATSLAQDRIEQFRAMTPAQIALLGNGSDTVAGDSGNVKFTRQWVVTPGPTGGMRQVTVTVTWTAPEARAVRMVAYLCRATTC